VIYDRIGFLSSEALLKMPHTVLCPLEELSALSMTPAGFRGKPREGVKEGGGVGMNGEGKCGRRSVGRESAGNVYVPCGRCYGNCKLVSTGRLHPF